MRLSRLSWGIVVAVTLVSQLTFAAKRATDIEPDSKAVAMIEGMVKAIQIDDEAARIKALIPFCHESMLKDGDLRFNMKRMLDRRRAKLVGLKTIKVTISQHIVSTGDPIRFGRFETKAIDRYQFEGSDGFSVMVSIVWVDGEPKAVSIPM